MIGHQEFSLRLCSSNMGSAILFLLLAAASPLLSAAKPLNYPNTTTKPPTVWINNAASLYHSELPTVHPIVISSVRPQAYPGSVFAFGAGFVCASTPTCDASLFAVFIVSVNDGMFSKVYPAQVVWSANRDRPVAENATLELTSDGNLVLCDADGSHIWSSSSSGKSVAGMVITEIGNLVLFDQSNKAVWQSFDHPTDTMVPGQSLVEGMRLTSSTSATNTTENQLYITVRPDGLYAYVESSPPQLYFSYPYSEPGHKKENEPTKVTFMNGSLGIFVQSDMYGSISMPATKSIQYMRLEYDGHLRLYQWADREWTVYDVMQMNDCAYPTVCGEYGVCNGGQCTCPHYQNYSSGYFMPVDERKPNLGCVPLTPISCEEMHGHQLLNLTGITYFDHNHTVVNVINEDDCKQACLKNCSCKAVLFSYDQSDPDGECMWVTNVFSLQTMQPELGRYNSSAYLKVQLFISVSDPDAKKKAMMLGDILGSIMLVAIAGIIVFVIVAVTRYLQRRRKEKEEEFDFDQLTGMPTRFSLKKLSECTEGFNKKLGEGGFGSVFEGKLGEETIAVKRLEGARQGKKEFLAEVETIGSIEHINLVRLIGFCAEKSHRLLVYEYMSRGSLDRWIYYRHNNAPIDWSTRYRIIRDIAKGLSYLHEECRRKIVHLDIKPQNILLDDNFNAKVADFGLCKLIDRDQSKVMTMMRGTPGYLAPEWLTSRITEKVDVYSFGVVIMEIISGRKNIDTSEPEENVHLINLLQEKTQNNQLIDLIDKHSDDMVSHQEEVIQMMKLATWCLQHESIQRPSMSTVVKVLEGAISVETFEANSIVFVQDNPSTYSVPLQASSLSGPR